MLSLKPLMTKVLLVEDHQLSQKITQRILNEAGCMVDIADNGKKGVHLALTRHYDIIFMDLDLPDMDGMVVVNRIRKSSGLSCHAPIIALSAYGGDVLEKHALAIGMNDFMSKPLSMTVVEEKLASWMRKRGSHKHDSD